MATDIKLMNELLEAAFDAYVDEDYEGSILNFQRVIQMNPSDKTAQRGLKQSMKMLKLKRKDEEQDERHRTRLIRKLMKKEKWLDAMDHTSTILANAPNNREVLEIQNQMAATFRERMSDAKARPGNDMIYQGMIHYLNRRYDDAVKAWREAASLQPENFKTVISIGRAEQVMKKGEKHEVLVLGRQRAKAFFASGNYEEAAKLWEKILEYDPGDKEARENLPKAREGAMKANRESLIGEHYDKGLELFNKGRYAESLAEWQSILQISPENEVARDYIERIRAKGVNAEIKVPLGPVKQPGSKIAGTDYAAGERMFNEQNFVGAIATFRNILKANPGDPKAGEWLNRATDAQAQAAQKHYTQGSLKYAEGRVDEAMKEWQEVLRIDPNHGPTLKVLSKISGGKK